MDVDALAAVGLLLTPLGGMAAAIFLLLTRRIKKLENENANLVSYVLTTCVDRSEDMAKLAGIIVATRTKGGDE